MHFYSYQSTNALIKNIAYFKHFLTYQLTHFSTNALITFPTDALTNKHIHSKAIWTKRFSSSSSSKGNSASPNSASSLVEMLLLLKYFSFILHCHSESEYEERYNTTESARWNLRTPITSFFFFFFFLSLFYSFTLFIFKLYIQATISYRFWKSYFLFIIGNKYWLAELFLFISSCLIITIYNQTTSSNTFLIFFFIKATLLFSSYQQGEKQKQKKEHKEYKKQDKNKQKRKEYIRHFSINILIIRLTLNTYLHYYTVLQPHEKLPACLNLRMLGRLWTVLVQNRSPLHSPLRLVSKTITAQTYHRLWGGSWKITTLFVCAESVLFSQEKTRMMKLH